MVRLYNLNKFRDRRRELRWNQTPAEKILWYYLRNKRLGSTFRRQFGVGGYILDFYCPEKKICIEVDGGIHNTNENKEYDQIRDKFLASAGIIVLRFSNEQVTKSIGVVLAQIKQNLESKSGIPSPY